MPDHCVHCDKHADSTDLVQVWGDAFMHPACSAAFYVEYNAHLDGDLVAAWMLPELGGEA